ncbi:SAP domain-containing ribonucleoprotein [Musca vetustissima]|uniref:SAP domain-containing ribonucleoprotein n=1 Tax=Musca vetustissima TaxID=27455 RepID=UPI002AB6503F|nr:SAP domain-containing ribonucleoprotein [Musca vetustissima]
MPVLDVANMKVADLKRELKDRGLSVAGNKNELQDRLQAALDGEPLLEDSSIAGEDILDEEAVLSDEEKILAGDENELLKSPTTTPTTILPTSKGTSDNNDSVLTEDEILESPTATAKKVVLKRKISVNNSGSTNESSNTTKENTEPTQAKTAKVSEHTPITVGNSGASATAASGTGATKKFSEMTLQERLELRAKKFGLSTASTATTPAVTTTNSVASNKLISQAPVVSSEKQVELLKKRAERFGCVTSTNLAKLDAEERRLKRLQRFGGEVTAKNNATTNATATTADSSEWAEKAKKRLERFGGSTTATSTTSTATPVTTATTTTKPVAAAASN